MCGIIGQLAFGSLSEELEKVRQESMIFLGSELLQMTQERGKDATGVCLLLDDGNYYGLKMGIPAIDFISRYGKNDKEYGGFIKVWRKSKKFGKVFLGHCRATTRGCSLDNQNNHPIQVGYIHGVHNGTIQNDDAIFKKLDCERSGAVDSEAIFRLLHHYTKNGTEPFTTDIMKETVEKLAGTYSVLAFSGNNPYQVCGFRDRKPFEMALIKPLKLLLVTSEKKFIETAVYRYNKYINLYITAAKFPTLKSRDVEYKTLQDDSAIVFDLRTEVNKNTEIAELYNWDKMPRVRVWGHGTGNSYTTQPKNHRQYGASSVKGGANAAGVKSIINRTKGKKEETANTGDDKESGARIWMSAIKGYVPEDSEEAKAMKLVGNVEIHIDKGTTNQLSKIEPTPTGAPVGKFALESVGATAIEDSTYIDKIPSIEQIKTPRKETVDNIEGEIPDMTSVEIDASVDTEAIEASNEETKRLEQYEEISEVIADLEIKDVETLEQIPLVSLANRIQKFVLKRGVYKGYLRRKNEEIGTADRVTLSKKKLAAEENVRTMKVIVKMLLRIIKSTGYINNHILEQVVTETLQKKEEVSKTGIDKLFTAGDHREHDIIRRMKEMVAGKEDR